MSNAFEQIIIKAFDKITKAPQVIDVNHSVIHAGQGFCMSAYHASLASAGLKNYRLKTGDLYVHLKNIEVAVMGSTCKIYLVEAPTITTAGTEGDLIQNMNRNSTTISETKAYDGTVAYTAGTGIIVCQKIVHGFTEGTNPAAGKSASSFAQNPDLEYILKPNTDYVLTIENVGASNALFVQCNAVFYEESTGLVPYGA